MLDDVDDDDDYEAAIAVVFDDYDYDEMQIILASSDDDTTCNTSLYAFSDYSAGQFAVAVIVSLWTYDGWNALNYVTVCSKYEWQ